MHRRGCGEIHKCGAAGSEYAETDCESGLPDIRAEIIRLIRQVPRGRVTTYSALADALGDTRARLFVSRLHNEMMLRKDEADVVPSVEDAGLHRVVNAGGKICGKTAAELLRNEGVPVLNCEIPKDCLETVIFYDFATSSPLRVLRKRQERFSRLMDVNTTAVFTHIAGIDVAYRGDTAFGAAVVYSYPDCKYVGSVTAVGHATFPYIPTYLFYREFSMIKKLVDKIITFNHTRHNSDNGLYVCSDRGMCGCLDGVSDRNAGCKIDGDVAGRYATCEMGSGGSSAGGSDKVRDCGNEHVRPHRELLVLIDGNGTLHPRGFGIASQVGVELGIPTAGIAKSLLCGTTAHQPAPGSAVPVIQNCSVAGYCYTPHGRKKKFYISPGHMITLGDALRVTKELFEQSETHPLEMAHNIATGLKNGCVQN